MTLLDTPSAQLFPRSACRRHQVASLFSFISTPTFTPSQKPDDVITHTLKFLPYIVSSATVWYAVIARTPFSLHVISTVDMYKAVLWI